jgi:uncharacterized membrane-anchored protein YhcB (DUF1043 family)
MTFEQVMLSLVVAAIPALWVRLTYLQRKLDEMIRSEATCQAKLDTLQRTVEQKHAENADAIASLYCKRNPE